MIRFTLVFLILFSFLGDSCSSRKNKLDHRGVIPEKELVSILTDVYIADGIIFNPRIHQWFASVDSLSSYHKIIEKHGYSKSTMDKTMKFYFIKKPKELIKIYDQVLGILSEMESIVEREAALEAGHVENLWAGKKFYLFPDLTGNDSAWFDITLNKMGIYTFAFSATLFPDDQAFNPRLTAFSCHPDSINTGKRKYIETINYIKDGQPHIYTFTINVPKSRTLHFKGWFYDFDNHPDEWEKHLRIVNISLTHITASV
jgi:hypothetical protein